MLWLYYWQLSEELLTQLTKTQSTWYLSTHSQCKCDVDAAISAMMTRRQVWLAQTTLLENIKGELTNMPVEPGKMFHSDSQIVLETAEQSLHTQGCVQHTFSHPGRTRLLASSTHTRLISIKLFWIKTSMSVL